MLNEERYRRFMVFAYDQYYPSGGMTDYDESFDTLEEAIASAEKMRADFKEILDLDERRMVWEEA